MNVWQKLSAFEQQRQIEHNKVMAQYEMLDNLSVDVPMNFGVCYVVEQTPFLHIVEYALSQQRSIYFPICQ